MYLFHSMKHGLRSLCLGASYFSQRREERFAWFYRWHTRGACLASASKKYSGKSILMAASSKNFFLAFFVLRWRYPSHYVTCDISRFKPPDNDWDVFPCELSFYKQNFGLSQSFHSLGRTAHALCQKREFSVGTSACLHYQHSLFSFNDTEWKLLNHFLLCLPPISSWNAKARLRRRLFTQDDNDYRAVKFNHV